MGKENQTRPDVCKAPRVTIVMNELVDICVIKAYGLIGIFTSGLRLLGFFCTLLLQAIIILPHKLIRMGLIRRKVLAALQLRLVLAFALIGV